MPQYLKAMKMVKVIGSLEEFQKIYTMNKGRAGEEKRFNREKLEECCQKVQNLFLYDLNLLLIILSIKN